MEQEKENQKTEQMEIEENQESSEAQQEKLREAKRSIQKKYAQKLQESDDDENSNQEKQKKQEQKDEDYQEKNQDQNQNQKSEITKKQELIKKNESQLDSVESRMQKLLEKAEKYTDFLIKRHQNRKSSMSLQERKKRGNWEEEQEEEKELLDDEEGQTEKNTYLQKQPSILKGGELKSYQLLGLNWMISLYESGLNGILADQMGLGKTIQTISLVAFLREFKKIKGPILIFGPKSTLGNWQKEFAKWLPAAKLVKLIATKEERGEILDKYISTGDFDVCLTSFEGVKICANYLKKISWQYMIIDEAHKLKNEESQLSKMIRTFDTKNKLLLTGTPLQNNLHELWSLLNFILPDLFKDSDIFDDWFSANQNQNVGGDVEQKNLDMIKQLHKILKPFMIRRTKAEVEKTMPPKKEIHLFIGLSGLQIDIYKKLLKKQNLTGDSDQQKKHYLNTLMQLRKCCNHPYLFEGVEDENLPVLGEHLVENCGKMRVLDKLLVKLHKEKHQVLIFSQMTMLLDVLEDYCNLRQYNYCRIDGSTDMDTRDKGINDFTKPNSDKFIFLLSTRAGGLGINLMTADTVVLYDSDWNPQMDLQAMDRAHRIGQKNQVNVYRFISENTVEEKIVERQTIKLRWDNLVIQQGKLTQKQKQLNKDELKDIIQHGAASIFKVNDGQGTFNDQEIDKLLERGDQKTKQFNDEIAKRLGSVAEGKIADKQNQDEKEEKDSEMNLGMQQINIYDFMDFNKNKEDEQVLDEIIARELEAQNETNRSRRDKKTMNYNINQQFMMQMQPTLPGQGSKIPEPKKIRLPEHQFFVNREKLQELLQLEEDYRVQNLINEKKELAKRENERRKLNNSRYHRYNRDKDKESNQQQEESQNQNEESQQQEKEKFEPKSCSWYVDLTEEEKEEKERLYKTGFPGWLKSDFESFVQGCTKYGRDNIEKIAKNIKTKPLEEVREYSKAFWERIGEMNDSSRIVKNIERGENILNQRKAYIQIIQEKCQKYRNPKLEIQFDSDNLYNKCKSKFFTLENDKYLVYLCFKHDYGNWKDIKKDIKNEPLFKYDFYFRSRCEQDINKRMQSIIKMLEKEREVNRQKEEQSQNEEKDRKKREKEARNLVRQMTIKQNEKKNNEPQIVINIDDDDEDEQNNNQNKSPEKKNSTQISNVSNSNQKKKQTSITNFFKNNQKNGEEQVTNQMEQEDDENNKKSNTNDDNKQQQEIVQIDLESSEQQNEKENNNQNNLNKSDSIQNNQKQNSTSNENEQNGSKNGINSKRKNSNQVEDEEIEKNKLRKQVVTEETKKKE